MTEPEITTHGNAHNGEYRLVLPDAEGTAKLSWHGDETVRVAAHTYVPPTMRGRGIAGKLVDRLIADARAEGFRIVPQCSYIASSFARHKEWSDLLAD